MERHGFDVISGLFGLLFVAIALIHLFSGAGDFDVRWGFVWPVVVVVGGIGILWSAIRRPDDDA